VDEDGLVLVVCVDEDLMWQSAEVDEVVGCVDETLMK
jgi:hypothetical protein